MSYRVSIIGYNLGRVIEVWVYYLPVEVRSDIDVLLLYYLDHSQINFGIVFAMWFASLKVAVNCYLEEHWEHYFVLVGFTVFFALALGFLIGFTGGTPPLE